MNTQKEVKHTPLVDANDFDMNGGGWIIKDSKDNVFCEVVEKENVPFIIKAINNHYKLLEALKECQQYILKHKDFRIKKTEDFHIANVMAQAIKESEG